MWAQLAIVATQFFLTLLGVFSGQGTLEFIVRWPLLSGNSPIAFLIITVAIASYLWWQSATLGKPKMFCVPILPVARCSQPCGQFHQPDRSHMPHQRMATRTTDRYRFRRV